MSEANNYVCFNVDQSGNHSEPTRLRARNNIGAAGLSSLAAPFESRAPSYVWSAGEVCTYGGALWQFDSDHSGAWTGADAHEVTIMEVIISMRIAEFVMTDADGSGIIDDQGEAVIGIDLLT